MAVKGHGALVGYKRFTGRVRYNDGDEAPEEPISTVGSPLKSWRLSPGVVGESRWAFFSRRGIVWEDFYRLPRWDMRLASTVAMQDAEIREEIMGRVFRESVRSYQVPKEIECDCAFLVEAADAIYVERMNEYLFQGVGRHPMLTDDRVRNFVVHETDPRRWKTAFALLVGTGRLVSFQDYTYFREVGAHGTDVRMSGLYEDCTKLLVSYDEFPEVPLCVAGIIPPRGLAFKSPWVAHYFGASREAQDGAAKKWYATAYVLEWAHAIAASPTMEHAVHNRVWVCEERCIALLRKFVSFEYLVVEVVGQEVAVVSFRKLVALLEKARELPPAFLESRVDYRSVTTVTWGVVRPGSSKFVASNPRSNARGAVAVRSPLDVMVPDSVFLGVGAWKTALSGKVFRGSSWAIREVLNILAERANR